MGEGLAGMVIGGIAAVFLSFGTVFVGQDASFRQAAYILASIVVFDLSAVPTTALVSHLMAPKVYDLESLKFDSLEPAEINITGKWEGVWIDSKKNSRESFRMTVEQVGCEVQGVAVFNDVGRTKAEIKGEVSGAKIRLIMSPQLTSPYHVDPETTWLGLVLDGNVSGEWYLHGKAFPGYATTGSWSATSALSE
jgi:hypothetical protein